MVTGHIHPRVNKDGSISYQLVVEEERDPMTGARRRHYKTVRCTKKEANVKLRKMIEEVENGGVTSASSMKTSDWLDEWLKLYLPNIEATTRDSYRDKIDNYIKPVLGDIPLKKLGATHVQMWINGLADKGLAPKTIRNAYNNLNAAMKKAVALKMISTNPSAGAELPKMKKYHAVVYTAAQVNTMLKAAANTEMYLPAALLVTTGVRRGELLALKWNQIDLPKRVIHIRDNLVMAGTKIVEKNPKSESGSRDITIGSDVVALLNEAKSTYDEEKKNPEFKDLGYVIHKTDGSPYRPDVVTNKWERFIRKNKLPHIRLHDLRHTHATLLIQAGISPAVVQQRLGHSDVTITLNTYTHVMPDMAKKAADQIESVIAL